MTRYLLKNPEALTEAMVASGSYWQAYKHGRTHMSETSDEFRIEKPTDLALRQKHSARSGPVAGPCGQRPVCST